VHILQLMKQKKLVFKRPKTVDMDRLCIFESLHKWWHDLTKEILLAKQISFSTQTRQAVAGLLKFVYLMNHQLFLRYSMKVTTPHYFLLISAAEGEAISYSAQPALPVPSSIV